MRSRKWTKASALITSVLCFVCVFASTAFARPWAEHAGHLAMLSKQIESGENEIRALILEKSHTNDPAKIREIINSIAARHKALEKSTKDYEEERQHVRFEHPEKNDVLKQTYTHHVLKSLEELAKETGLDGRLDQAKVKVLSTFPLPERKVARPSPLIRPRKPASIETDEDAPEKIHLIK